MSLIGGAKYGPLKPYDWPQDKSKVPNGQGLMPRVDERNSFVSKREGCFYTQGDTFAGATAIRREYIIPTEPDGDFWCNGISAIAVNQVSLDFDQVPGWKVQIEDLRTGWNLTFPFVRFGFFQAFPASGVADANRPIPGSGSSPFKATSTLIQPFCFTRNGGIKLSIDTTGVELVDAQAWQICFSGWKEYQYASR
jgi:hypothetical protein